MRNWSQKQCCSQWRTTQRRNGQYQSSEETKKKRNIVFTTLFFQEVDQLKTFVKTLESDIKRLIGDVRIIFALRMSRITVKNRKLIIGEVDETQVATRKTQGCGAARAAKRVPCSSLWTMCSIFPAENPNIFKFLL